MLAHERPQDPRYPHMPQPPRTPDAPGAPLSAGEAGGAGDSFFASIPFLGGALAALVRPPAANEEPGDLSDADTRAAQPHGADNEEDHGPACAPPSMASGDAHGGSRTNNSEARRPEAQDGTLEARTCSSSTCSSDIYPPDLHGGEEKAMLLAATQNPNYPNEAPAQDSQPPNLDQKSWVRRLQRRMAQFRSRTPSPAESPGNDRGAEAHDPADTLRLDIPARPATPHSASGDACLAPSYGDDEPTNPPKPPIDMQEVRRMRRQASDPTALTELELRQNAKMRDEVVRSFAKHLDNLELGEKLAKVTGDLGKNLGKAGDKLMNVWDLNDLKDDTLEMKEHVSEDLKEDLDKHVKGAHEAVGKAKDAMDTAKGVVGEHIVRTGMAIKDHTPRLLEDFQKSTPPLLEHLHKVSQRLERSQSPARVSPAMHVRPVSTRAARHDDSPSPAATARDDGPAGSMGRVPRPQASTDTDASSHELHTYVMF